MPKKSFRSSFTSCYLVPSDLYKPLIKCLNEVQFRDVERFNDDAITGKMQSISEGSISGQDVPPVVKVNEPITSKEIDQAKETFNPFLDDDENEESKKNDEEKVEEEDAVLSDSSFSSTTGTSKQQVDSVSQTPGVETATMTTQTDPPSPSVKKSEVALQTDATASNKDVETQTDGILDLKRCDKCNGLFQGSNKLIQHKKFFHNSADSSKRKKTPVNTSEMDWSTSNKRKSGGMPTMKVKTARASSNSSKIPKFRGEKRKRKQQSDDPDKKEKLQIQYTEGEDSIEDIEELKKGRKKSDLQKGSGTFDSFFADLKKNVVNSKKAKLTKSAFKKSFPHWM